MRQFILLSSLILISACNALAPTNTPPAASSTRLAAVTPPGPATVTPPPPPPPELAQFDAALRPEFRNDLSLVHSPTIYRMNLRLDSSLSRLSADESVTYTNRTLEPLAQVYFRLFANYPSPGSADKESVTSVRVNGVAVDSALEAQDTALNVPLVPSLAPNATVIVDLRFEVTIPVSSTTHYADFTNSEGIITLPSAYPLIPAHDDKGWHTELPPPYGDLVYADASVYDVTITAPITETVIASGSAVETTTQGGEKTWHFIAAPMRDLAIDISASMELSSTQVGGVTVNSYYLAQDAEAGKRALDAASGALGNYEGRIGAYPFKELDVVESPTTAGGIEYPGLVVISDRLYQDPQQSAGLEFDVAHEVGHQWWYSQVGDDQVNSPWMDESLVQYTTLIYLQDTYGAGEADRILNTFFQALYTRAKKDNEDMPVGLPVATYTEKQYSEIVYGKGPLFFDAVRKQIGDESFYKFMRTYYQRFKYQIAKPEDMLRTIDEVSGQKVDALYNQWILGK